MAARDGYMAITTKHDATAAASDGVLKAFQVMGQLRQYVDPGCPNRKWNDSLALVETNKAALMIVGDWAKGEFEAAHLKIDQDWGCAPAPGTQDSYVMQTNAFTFPKTSNPEQIAAQKKLADVFMDPTVQTEYTFYKGSIPSRLDAELGQKVMAGGPAHQLSHFSLSFTPDVQGQIQDLLGQYWAHPEMSADAARKRFGSIIAGSQ